MKSDVFHAALSRHWFVARNRNRKMGQYNHPLGSFLLGVAVALISGQSLAQENTDWKDRLFAEAPRRWEDYCRFARSLQVTKTGTSSVKNGKDQPTKSDFRVEYKQTKGACLVLRQTIEPEFQATVEGGNPSYLFELIRRSPDKGWVIKKLVVSGESTTFSDEQRKLQEEQLRTLCDCIKLGAHPLPMIINDPDFKITGVKPQETDACTLVRFDFEYPKPDNKDYPFRGGMRIKGGWMILDPEHDWILREYRIHDGLPEKFFDHVTFQVREGTDRHPIVTHQKWEMVSIKNGGYENIGGSEWQQIEKWDVPLEEFTLSAFGLPEPPGMNVQESRLHLWIALGGISCIGIAALIRWQARRARVAA